jgi:hypothetical protein
MGRKVNDRRVAPRLKKPYRSAGLSTGGMAHQIGRDVAIFDTWGRKLAFFRSSSTAGIAWLSAKRWLEKHPEAGVLAEKSWMTTQEDILSWVKERKDLYKDLDEEQRKDVEAAYAKNMRPE